jgi:AMP nucleosidase
MEKQEKFEQIHLDNRATTDYILNQETDHKLNIVSDCLSRYTGMPRSNFSKYIILTNFYSYIEIFSKAYNGSIYGNGKMMQACTANGITMINIGMGSPNAALSMDLLLAIEPEAVLFLGKCGGIKNTELGDFIVPIGGIRGTSVCYEYDIPENVPCLPYLEVNLHIASTLKEKQIPYKNGTIFTTARRIWEHNERFKDKLIKSRAIGVDMETATLFTVGYHNKIPNAALLLVSDLPMTPEGVKTEKSDMVITTNFVNSHITCGVDIMQNIIKAGGVKKHEIF